MKSVSSVFQSSYAHKNPAKHRHLFRTSPPRISRKKSVKQMTKILSVLLVCSALVLTFCKQTTDRKAENNGMPANATPIQVQISHLNCWTEGGQFYVTGICNSQSDQWKKIWLRMEALDSSGKTVSEGVVFPVFSASVPPRGRSAFFRVGRLQIFQGCRILAA